MKARSWTLAALGLTVALGCGCGRGARSPAATGIPAALLREVRPIGLGVRFRPPVRGPVIGPCRARLGPRHGVHIELFAANRVVVLGAGIGVGGPVSREAGRITRARCYGALATLEPTGVVLLRPGARLTLADVFRAWGQPLSRRRAASFRAPTGDPVRVFVAGRPQPDPPGGVPLVAHGEIVVEVGPRVPPHASYVFPPGT
ncbi:MAG: hypothetical protein ACR2GZ_08910 [Solirubrobacteraceae bacterium]